MFVSESALNFVTKLQVVSSEGLLWEGLMDPGTTVEDFKAQLFQYFYPGDTVTGPENFRVIFPQEQRDLLETHALSDEKVKENDVLLFVRKRSANNPVLDADKDLNLKTPTAQEIAAATASLPVVVERGGGSDDHGGGRDTAHQQDFRGRNFLQRLQEIGMSTEGGIDFQTDLKKIIISLVSLMGTLLHANKDAELICKQVHTRVTRRLEALSKRSTTTPAEGSQSTTPPPPAGSSRVPPPPTVVECTPMGIVSGLSEVRRREFTPNPKALEALKELGYEEEEIIEALRASRNSKDAAAEWLATSSEEKKQVVVPQEETGLDPDSHLLNALVSAPAIRLGLSNPKTLLAFLNILESPAAANVWLNDADTAPVLSTIFKIYHAEKHAAAAAATVLEG